MKKRLLDVAVFEKVMEAMIAEMSQAKERCREKGDVAGQERWLIRIEQSREAILIAQRNAEEASK